MIETIFGAFKGLWLGMLIAGAVFFFVGPEIFIWLSGRLDKWNGIVREDEKQDDESEK